MASPVTAAVVGAAILLGATAPAYAATDPAGNPPAVQFSTARGDAPVLQPGVQQTAAPTGSTERYAAIRRPKDGSVAVAIFGSVDAEITTPDGQTTCSNSSIGLDNGESGYTFVYVDAGEDQRQSYLPDECKSATDLILQVKTDDSPLSSSSPKPSGPLLFAVSIEPKLANGGPPAPKNQQNKITAPSRTGTSRTLSHQLVAPTTLTPGSYQVELTPGKLAIARVRLGWGQRLAASVDAPRNSSNFAPPQSLELSVAAFSPQWAPVGGGGDDSALLSANESTEQTASTYTAAVRAGNRALDYGDTGDVGTNEAQWATVAGWYYVVIRVDAADEGEKLTTKTLPARLNLAVTGSPAAGPSYVGANGSAQAAPPATELSQGGHANSGSGTTTVLRVAGSLLVLALAAGAIVVLLRRRA